MHEIPYWRLAGAYFFYFAYLGAFAPYFSLYLSALGMTAAGIGVVMALPQLVRIFAPYLWGWLADRGGRCLIIARVATLAGVVVYCGLFADAGFEVLIAVVLLMSFFLSAALPLTEVVTFAHLGSKESRYGRIRVWGSIGFIAAVLIVGYLLDRLPVAALLWILLTLLLGTLAALMFVPEAPTAEHPHDGASISQVIRHPHVIALISACALMAIAHGPYYTFYSIYLVDHGYSKGAVGWLWGVGVICEIAIFYWMSHLFRAYTLRQVLIASFALAALRFALIAWFADSLIMLLLAQVLHAASFGSFHAAALGLINQHFPGRYQGRGQAIYTSLSFGLGGTLGALYAGYAWERFGAAMTFTGAGLCALAGMAILCHWLRAAKVARAA
jgi:MFS transporter, PPP family, 3-phenylpropionic acid transporter